LSGSVTRGKPFGYAPLGKAAGNDDRIVLVGISYTTGAGTDKRATRLDPAA
jgi:hypothetical protein